MRNVNFMPIRSRHPHRRLKRVLFAALLGLALGGVFLLVLFGAETTVQAMLALAKRDPS